MAVLVFYHYKSETDYRAQNIRNQLSLINNRIIAAYEEDIDIEPFMKFISRYFDDSVIDDVMVSVYDNSTGRTIHTIGPTPSDAGVIDISDTTVVDPEEIQVARQSGVGMSQRMIADKMFYVSARQSNDGRITVHTALTFSPALSDALAAKPTFWIVVSLIAVIATIIAYYSAQYMSRSVRLLKNFADNIEANNGGITNLPDFPHDELGDISRRIIELYREKSDAIIRSEREHAVALNAVQERARLKRQLTNNLNHELKTPIGVIRGYLDTIQDNPDMDEATLRRFVDRAHQNVERLCAMLEDVSTITRLEEGVNNIPMEDVDFHDLIYNLEHDLIASGTCGNMTFSNDIPLNCHVRGNASLLMSMIGNLARNAVAHSKGSEMGIKLIIESKKFYTFGFWDNGQGVETEHLNRLFERFYRIDSGRSRKVGGTGLGLPIVKNTVEAHNGTISVHNRAIGGLEFIFTLPKFDADDSDKTAADNDNDPIDGTL
ncbi:MAG: HAMP domain-containing histidine kinase [Pseudoflavonifractor sp.]|nr:HAMP domain-containing histidine kinase [Pseudoflavonifractor sp.]